MISWAATYWNLNGRVVPTIDNPRLILLWADGVVFESAHTRGPYASVKAAAEARMIWRLKRGEVSLDGAPGVQGDLFK